MKEIEREYLNLYKKFGYKKIEGNWRKCILKISNGENEIYFYNNGYVRLGKVFNFFNGLNYRLYKLNNKNKFYDLNDMYIYVLKFLVKKYK